MEIIRKIEVFERNSENDFVVEEYILENLNIIELRKYFNISVFNDENGEEDEPDYEMVFHYEIYLYHESIFLMLYPNIKFNFDKYQYFLCCYAKHE